MTFKRNTVLSSVAVSIHENAQVIILIFHDVGGLAEFATMSNPSSNGKYIINDWIYIIR